MVRLVRMLALEIFALTSRIGKTSLVRSGVPSGLSVMYARSAGKAPVAQAISAWSYGAELIPCQSEWYFGVFIAD